MEKFCKGCGIALQSESKDKVGFTKNLEMDYCTRCFRLMNYGDTEKLYHPVDASSVLQSIASINNALYIWVVDLYHLEESLIPSLFRWLKNSEIVLLLTKREILPKTLSVGKIRKAVEPFIKESHCNIVDVLITSKAAKDEKSSLLKKLSGLKIQYNKDNIVFFGSTNAGKSTLINTLFSGKVNLTVSAFPGTTLECIQFESEIGTVYDTPGIDIKDNILNKLNPNEVKLLQPKQQLKPITYQLSGNQSLILKGLAKVDFIDATDLSVTLYFPDAFTIHRTKVENSQKQFDRFKTLDFSLDEKEFKNQTIHYKSDPFDIVFWHIGFMSIKGNFKEIKIQAHKDLRVTERKGMI